MRPTILISVLLLGGAATAQEKAPLLEGIGHHTFPVTTKSAEAQTYFDQGLVLAYGFNHEEAHRSFLYCAKLDPDCAMAYWGAALVLGPNLNAGMPSSANKKAFDLAQKALAKLDDESQMERALIEALQSRYEEGKSRREADVAYADAMRKVAQRFPDDSDVLTLTAEALMDLHPWNFYTNDKTPQPWTKEITDILDRSLSIDPMNPGTNHFIIHSWEASSDPNHAIPCADRLAGLAPGVEHLVHMPAHIYLRVGRYHDATECNLLAAQAYDDYESTCKEAGLSAIGGYKMHNWDYMWAAASMEGRSGIAMKAANYFHNGNANDLKLVYSQVRFGKWDDLLATRPGQSASTAYKVSVAYGRAIAHVRKGDLDAAQSEYAALLELVGDAPRTTYKIARYVAAGEIAAARGDYEGALRAFESAAESEDSMGRAELPGWHQPVRHVLGKVLIDAGRFADAEKAYRESLATDPENGWSLFGLAQALEGQGKTGEAARVRARFKVAWKHADVVLTSSRM